MRLHGYTVLVADKELTQGHVRSRFRDLDIGSNDQDNKAYAPYVSLAPATPLGHFQLIVSGSPVALPAVPAEARRVFITSIGQPIEFRDDGVMPDGTNGYPIPADTHFVYDNNIPAAFRLVLSVEATGDADVRGAYYG
jgi:hypothetical protein